MCAERVAIFKAVSEGYRSFTRIVVVADTSQPTSPCGACRQMLWEFAGDIEVILADLDKIKTTHRLKDLLGFLRRHVSCRQPARDLRRNPVRLSEAHSHHAGVMRSSL